MRQKVIDKCFGEKQNCSRIEGEYCNAYEFPDKKWIHNRDCNLATHIIKVVGQTDKQRVGQQKQKKKTRKG